MDIASFFEKQFPKMVRGAVDFAVARMSQPPEQPDLGVKFGEQRVDLFNRYQAELEASASKPPVAVVAVAPAALPQHVGCPFCELEEVTGNIRNHLAFISKECHLDSLGTATGGMVPKVRDQVTRARAMAHNIEHQGGNTEVLAKAIAALANDLEPKLEWISTCEAAQEASIIAQRMWEIAAKAAQLNFSKDGSSLPGR